MSDKDLIADARAAVDYSDDTGWFWVGRLADALEAATRERDAALAATKQAKEELAASLDLRAYWRSQAIEARAERDAALAVLERIREAVSGHPECDRYEEGDVISCGWKSAYASVVAALDGAPEPEWEYSRGVLNENGLLYAGVGLPRDQVIKVRRRPAGPWLPVEGEKP